MDDVKDGVKEDGLDPFTLSLIIQGRADHQRFTITYGSGVPANFDPVGFKDELFSHLEDQTDQKTGLIKLPLALFRVKKPFSKFITDTLEY